MTSLLRILGVEVMVQLGRRLPAPVSRLLSALVLLLANLFPIWAVLEGRLGMGDVLVLYWFENCVVWFTTTIRILTIRPGGKALRARSWMTGDLHEARSFATHYGLFTLAHGVFSIVLAAMVGLEGGPLDWVAVMAAILFGHALSMGLHWFGRHERDVVSIGWVAAAPYPRMVALHLTVILGFILLGGPHGPDAADPANIALLMAAKTGLDLVFHVSVHLALGRRATRPEAVRTAWAETEVA